jgi:DNA-binding response OmpR family regulator
MSRVLIISKDADFSDAMAEQLRQELAAEVDIAENAEKAEALMGKVQLVLATEVLPGNVLAPVLLVGEKPLRLQDILTKTAQQLAKEELPLGDALFSMQQKTLTRGDKTASLTDKESQLLLALLKNKEGAEKEALLRDVWGVVNELESHTLETHVYRLRAKLKEIGVAATIAAAPGKYMLEI